MGGGSDERGAGGDPDLLAFLAGEPIKARDPRNPEQMTDVRPAAGQVYLRVCRACPKCDGDEGYELQLAE